MSMIEDLLEDGWETLDYFVMDFEDTIAYGIKNLLSICKNDTDVKVVILTKNKKKNKIVDLQTR